MVSTSLIQRGPTKRERKKESAGGVCACVHACTRVSSDVGSRILKRGRLDPIWATAPQTEKHVEQCKK